MRKLALATLSAVALVASRATVVAENRFDGNHLIKDCANAVAASDPSAPLAADEVVKVARCQGFVYGIVASYRVQADLVATGNGPANSAFCVPAESTVEQLERVFLKYLEEHPADLHKDGAALAFSAFAEAWPCPAKATAPSANGKSGPLCPTCDLSTPAARLARQVKLVDNSKDLADCRFLGTVTGWEDSERKNGGFQLATKAGAYAGGKTADVRVLHVDGADDRAYLCGGAAK